MRRHSEKSPRIRSKTMQSRLKRNNEGLVAYLISDDASFALGANGDMVQLVRLDIRSAELQQAVDSLVAPFHGAEKTFRESIVFRAGIAHHLYRRLLQPVESVMALPEKVIIVPDLQMANLPFEILLSAAPLQKEYTLRETLDCPGLFLLQRYCFSYAPSVSVLVRKEKPARRYPDIAVFSNPFDGTSVRAENRSPRSRPGWRLVPLPFSDVEARGIRDVCRRTHIFKRSKATKNAFYREASKRQILHFATHAFVDPAFDDFSGLVMAAGSDSTDDGLLMGYEIADLSLKCDLVALSACETGCGRFVEGEGVLGIPRLFLKSGVQSVMMTLWKVDDRFASVLMPRFYGGWLNRGHSKTSALCEAKRAFLQRRNDSAAPYAHPFYWASFVLYGDPGLEQTAVPAGRPVIAAVWGFTVGLILLAGWRFYFRRREPGPHVRADCGKSGATRRPGTGP
jgi:CHAT domain-containing protein